MSSLSCIVLCCQYKISTCFITYWCGIYEHVALAVIFYVRLPIVCHCTVQNHCIPIDLMREDYHHLKTSIHVWLVLVHWSVSNGCPTLSFFSSFGSVEKQGTSMISEGCFCPEGSMLFSPNSEVCVKTCGMYCTAAGIEVYHLNSDRSTFHQLSAHQCRPLSVPRL